MKYHSARLRGLKVLSNVKTHEEEEETTASLLPPPLREAGKAGKNIGTERNGGKVAELLQQTSNRQSPKSRESTENGKASG